MIGNISLLFGLLFPSEVVIADGVKEHVVQILSQCPKDIYEAVNKAGCATSHAKALILGNVVLSPERIPTDDIAGVILEALIAEDLRK